jgi:hypothetical protein
MQVLLTFLRGKSDHRVYVDVYPLSNRVGWRQRHDAVANTCGPPEVAVDVHLNPSRSARRVIGDGGGRVDEACSTTETASVAPRGQADQCVDPRLAILA